MIIALDYDKTYTADPMLWDEFIGNCKLAKHEVICITMRHNNEAEKIKTGIAQWDIKIYYTSRKAKKTWADENGIWVDIWIDDKPAWLFQDAA